MLTIIYFKICWKTILICILGEKKSTKEKMHKAAWYYAGSFGEKKYISINS